jgi:hypothetical protein
VPLYHSCLTTYNNGIQIAHGAAVAMGHDGIGSVRLHAHLCPCEFGVGHTVCFDVASVESRVALRIPNIIPTGLDGRCDRNRGGTSKVDGAATTDCDSGSGKGVASR